MPAHTGDQLLRDIYAFGATSGHVARILNVSEAAVSLWGNGKRRPCEYNHRRLLRLRDDLATWNVDAAVDSVQNPLRTATSIVSVAS